MGVQFNVLPYDNSRAFYVADGVAIADLKRSPYEENI